MFTDQQYTCLVTKYIDTVFRLALSYTKNISDAEDMTQTVFLKLLQEKKEFDSEEHIRFWLIRVTVNTCKNFLRFPWHRHTSLEEVVLELPDTTAQDREVLRAVMELPGKYRTPVFLHYFEGYSTAEIAQILKIPKGTVCTNLARGRELLKKRFLEDE